MRTATEIICPCGAQCGREYPDRISHLDGGEPGYSEGVGENYVVAGVWHCSPTCAIATIDEKIEILRWVVNDWRERPAYFVAKADAELTELYRLRVGFWEEQNRVSPQNASESRQNRL